MGFEGVIFSDDLSMKAANCSSEYLDRTRLALNAGCDMALICNDSEKAITVAEKLGNFNNPASQMRLARMHGEKDPLSYNELRKTEKWKRAVGKVESYQESPFGELTIKSNNTINLHKWKILIYQKLFQMLCCLAT